jgi:hypothetical protein
MLRWIQAKTIWRSRGSPTGGQRPRTSGHLARRPARRPAQLHLADAITIRAPAARVWPWLVQLGQGRGGLYGYDWLENLLGCDIHSTDRILRRFRRPAGR